MKKTDYIKTDNLEIKKLINDLYKQINDKDREISRLRAENDKLFNKVVILESI